MNLSSNETQEKALTPEDILVFGFLELLGLLALVGNIALITVIIRYKYLNKASFILICSLAIADLLHATVTTSYFYPPIVLKENHMPPLGCRIMTMIDWTAWGITISHMSAVCIDRVIAIMLFGKYMQIMTASRVKTFSLTCWILLATMNIFFFIADYCCFIVPQESSDYYSFDFNEPLFVNGTKMVNYFNVYPPIYTPLEVMAMLILAVSNPITLVNLWRRHKRKMALRRASAMLLEMSQTMTIQENSEHSQSDQKFGQAAKDAAKVAKEKTSAAAKQQQRIFIQIITVTVIFFVYMFVYYLFFYAIAVADKWAVVFNSFFYSITHILNPLVYFGLNQEMRSQLLLLFGVQINSTRSARLDKRVKKAMKRMSPPKNNINERSPLLGPKRYSKNLDTRNAISLVSLNSDKSVGDSINNVEPNSLVTNTSASPSMCAIAINSKNMSPGEQDAQNNVVLVVSNPGFDTDDIVFL